MKFWKNRKGFTLAELCVVMAIFAIVGTMVTTTLIYVTRQNDDIQKEAAFIAEVTEVQKKVNDWLKKYDSAGYTVTRDSTTALKATKGTKSATIKFADHTIQMDGITKTEKYKNVSRISFEIIEEKTDGTVTGKIVQLTATTKKGKGTQSQTLLFPLFSGETRSRSVTGKNG